MALGLYSATNAWNGGLKTGPSGRGGKCVGEPVYLAARLFGSTVSRAGSKMIPACTHCAILAHIMFGCISKTGPVVCEGNILNVNVTVVRNKPNRRMNTSRNHKASK